MRVFEANIPPLVLEFLRKKIGKRTTLKAANEKMAAACGITEFFTNNFDFEIFKEVVCTVNDIIEDPDRSEYGDFQTNLELASKIAEELHSQLVNPTVIVEPTCGRGNFILASLVTFQGLKKVLGVEIYKPYIWETKFNILHYFLNYPDANMPEIELIHYNVFDFKFEKIAEKYSAEKFLILGNPPWVTNSKLGSLESMNLPVKSNFKNHSGFDAITGKGNFDIGEYITMMMFSAFQNSDGYFAFLVKNSIIKNILFEQRKGKYRISNIKKLNIDSKKEFNVSVEASLLFCKLNQEPEIVCEEYNFYDKNKLSSQFGWVQDKFVSNVSYYTVSGAIDGRCPFEWRQGIKHDLSSIMELQKVNGHYYNGLDESVSLENELVFGLLKSSDLKHTVINTCRKFTIVTQSKVGQDTSYIKNRFPKTYKYLNQNRALFDLRKSSIYNNKPDFSIFGIGDYSFTPYKVSISGLYKKYSFNLVLPIDGKPTMLDDTCYLLGFDSLEFATYTLLLLNSDRTRDFLQSITFSDAKRTFTKDVLMRIDLLKLAQEIMPSKLKEELKLFSNKFNLKVSPDKWNEYKTQLSSQTTRADYRGQLTLLEGQAKYNKKYVTSIEVLPI